MDSPSAQHAAPQAHNVGMEAHRAVGVEESGRDGDGNRVVMLAGDAGDAGDGHQYRHPSKGWERSRSRMH